MLLLACADGGLVCGPLALLFFLASWLGWRKHKHHTKHHHDHHHDCKED